MSHTSHSTADQADNDYSSKSVAEGLVLVALVNVSDMSPRTA